MSPIARTYVTWEELYGQSPSEQEIVQGLRALDRLHTVLLLARISIHLALDRFHNDPRDTAALQGFLIRNFVDDGLLQKLKERYGQERLDFRYAFHRQQVLTLAKWAVLEGAKDGGVRPDEDEGARYRLGRCLLMTSDLLLSPEMRRALKRVSRKKKLLSLQLQLGSGFEINNPPEIKASIVRSDVMFREHLRQITAPLDVAGIFKARTGFELAGYMDMVFAVLIHYVTKTQQQLNTDPGLCLVNLKTFFNMLPYDQAEKFWGVELATLGETAAELSKPSNLKPQHDFIVFRRKPFIQVSEQAAVCINPGFLQEKLESGLFWSIFNSLDSDKDRQRLFNTWGLLFERYVSDLLASAIAGDAERYVPFPRFADNNDEAFDGVVVAGDKWIVLEYKGGFLKGEAKYAENEGEFVRDLQLKFGVNPGASVEQLVRKIGDVFAAKECERRQINGLDPARVATVVPVLVVQEPFISSILTAQYLCSWYRHLRGQRGLAKSVSCTGLVVLDVEDVQALRPYVSSGKIIFTDCIIEKARLGDESWLDFREFFERYLKERQIERMSDRDLDERFKQIMDRVSHRFFGRGFAGVEGQG